MMYNKNLNVPNVQGSRGNEKKIKRLTSVSPEVWSLVFNQVGKKGPVGALETLGAGVEVL